MPHTARRGVNKNRLPLSKLGYFDQCLPCCERDMRKCRGMEIIDRFRFECYICDGYYNKFRVGPVSNYASTRINFISGCKVGHSWANFLNNARYIRTQNQRKGVMKV